MGHERFGNLPKSERWRSIVQQIATSAEAGAAVSEIAAQTLQNVRHRFRLLQHDESTKAAFRFLVSLAISTRSDGGPQAIGTLLGDTSTPPTPLRLARALRAFTEHAGGAPEYQAIAHGAAVDALATWYDRHRPRTESLFESFRASDAVWAEAGTRAGFCEISRLFFAKCTERYLRYFLEREATSVLPGTAARERFGDELAGHVDRVSQHAFETAKITQSFAAGWFNKHAATGVPPERDIEGFLSHAFGKLRDELAREGRNE